MINGQANLEKFWEHFSVNTDDEKQGLFQDLYIVPAKFGTVYLRVHEGNYLATVVKTV